MKRQAIMFDLDGTLLDTIEDLGDAMNMALRERGLPEHDYPFYRLAVGDGARMLAMRSLPESQQDDASVDALFKTMRRHYASLWNKKTHPYDGIPELIDSLAALDIVMTILSNKPDAALQKCVNYFLQPQCFAVVRGVLPDGPVKPDPTSALNIMETVKIPAGEWLYVGDTNTDMQTAKAAGLIAVGCSWGFRDREELLASGADVIVDSPSEILTLLG